MKTDIQIAKEANIRHIEEIAGQLGIAADDLELYGKHKAKIPLSYIDEEKVQKNKLILVTAITPTPAGEGKTTISIGLTQGMNKIGKKTAVVLREPSLGPVFGIKGGAAGGGYSQVIPMEDINLHFTGDLNAIEKAHNLLAALIDNNIQNKKFSLGIDPRTVRWKRVIDMNDRSLRNIVEGLGGIVDGVPRESGFDITAASEVMAILCMSKNMEDLKQRLGNIFVGFTFAGEPIYARDLKANGAMAALLKDAIKPNLVQTLDGNPAIIHGGPFANIAQGTNSIIATKMGLSLSDYVVTEAGFASDLGAEKFLNLKCRYAGLSPHAVVLVATIRALKHHGCVQPDKLNEPNVKQLIFGLKNMEKHIENIKAFNLCPVVAINKFATDTEEEINAVIEKCEELGVKAAVADVWGKGGEGAVELAKMVAQTADTCADKYVPLYSLEDKTEDKIKKIATEIYGAAEIEYASKAKKDLKRIAKLGLDKLPVCIAKTQKSLSDNPKRHGRPQNFTITINEIEISAGAGFLVPIAGSIMRMPGLPAKPSAELIDIDEHGEITGLF